MFSFWDDESKDQPRQLPAEDISWSFQGNPIQVQTTTASVLLHH
jgi:hypothetical protein